MKTYEIYRGVAHYAGAYNYCIEIGIVFDQQKAYVSRIFPTSSDLAPLIISYGLLSEEQAVLLTLKYPDILIKPHETV